MLSKHYSYLQITWALYFILLSLLASQPVFTGLKGNMNLNVVKYQQILGG